MFKMIKRPADCAVRSVIRFLNARNVKPADIHRQIGEVYSENAMSDAMARKWVSNFNEGRDNVHEETRRGRPSVVTSGHLLQGRGTETGAPLYDKCLIMVKTM